MDKEVKYWLRWIAVLPVAIIAGLAASILIRTILYYTIFLFLPPGTTVEAMLTPVLNAAGFIFFGSLIAPGRNKKTLLALFLLFLVIVILIAILAWTGFELFGKKLVFSNGLLIIALSILGACIGMSLANSRYKKFNSR